MKYSYSALIFLIFAPIPYQLVKRLVLDNNLQCPHQVVNRLRSLPWLPQPSTAISRGLPQPHPGARPRPLSTASASWPIIMPWKRTNVSRSS
ncbi:hypothetical protein TOPH_01367 [Tolypocladium ophioglossoides CBS 100239]|uniref:Uncharacterized protein n=1 Tax=Tolypocladium ophioglossoides (strain CBS 100239) TaxID=1163406 RepID=A0A0L0NKD6_TOLOC|nr:hypothetical protein TOPH_01367 [Tolypocladium ophioglossoides CBS 100239]